MPNSQPSPMMQPQMLNPWLMFPEALAQQPFLPQQQFLPPFFPFVAQNLSQLPPQQLGSNPQQQQQRQSQNQASSSHNQNNPPTQENRSPIVPPSEASGGVPEPTEAYMAAARVPPFVLPQPREILIVLDLNGTLLHRHNRAISRTSFIARPNANLFLQYCVRNFRVVIWSSARPDNVGVMCDRLLDPPMKKKIVAIWGRDKFGLTRDDYMSRVQCYKRLTTVWDDAKIQASHPEAATGGKWDQTNTVLVDDSLEKGRSEPLNLIEIPEFTAEGDNNVQVLPQVHDYINTLCKQANISSYMRQSPFRINPSYEMNEPL